MVPRLRAESGFTIVETIVAAVVMLVGLLGVVVMIDYANLETGRNRDREAANNLVRQIAETAKKVPYASATPTGLGSTLRAQPGLHDAVPATPEWEIMSRGVTFKVTTSTCSVDDAKDGYGDHTGGTFCGTSTGVADTSPEDYRRLTVTVDPIENSQWDRKTSISSFIANSRSGESSSGGSGSSLGEGFAIMMDPLCVGCSEAAWSNYGQVAPCKTFTVTAGADNCLPTYNGVAGPNYSGNSITSIPVKAVFPTGVASAKFYVVRWGQFWHGFNWPAVWPPTEFLGNGAQAGDPRAWTYTWALDNTYPNQTPDGQYDVRAIGYDAQGAQVGQPLVLSFWLNRFVPDLSYYVLRAGRNQQSCSPRCASSSNATPEIEWTPKPSGARRDTDVKDFKVFRNGTTTPVVCTMGENIWRASFQYSSFGHRSSPSICRDTASPTPSTASTSPLQYTLRATNFSPDGMSSVEGGNAQTSLNVNLATANAAPQSPTGFASTWTTIAGTKYMRWTWGQSTSLPNSRGDSSPPPDCIASYRIYRTSSSGTSANVIFTARVARTSTGMLGCLGSPSATTSYTMPTPGGYNASNARFWITSVDTWGNESIPVQNTANMPAP